MQFLDLAEKEGRIGLQNYYFENNKDNIRLDIGKKHFTIYRYDRNATHGLWSIETENNLSADIRKYITEELKTIIKNYLNTDVQIVKRASDLLCKYGNDTRSIHDQVINLMKTYQRDNGINALFDANTKVLNFKNGILELDTGNFRPRTKEDYITKCLNYDYTEDYDPNIMKEIIDIYMKVFNNNPYEVNTQLLWDAYCITGETSDQKFMVYFGKTGANGKSMLLKIKENVFNNGKDTVYVYKVANDVFSPKCQNRNKDLCNLMAPCRLAYLEELSEQSKMDQRLLKDFVSGATMNCKPLHMESINFQPQCKWSIATNEIPEFDKTDEAFNRRPLLQVCKNKFVDSDEFDYYERNACEGTKIYIKDYRLSDKFLETKYKIAYVNLLLNYTVAYFKRGSLYNISYLRKMYVDEVIGFDYVKNYIDTWLDTKCQEITPGIDVFEHFSKTYEDCNILKEKFLSMMKRNGMNYDSQKKKESKKGCYIGIRILDTPKKSTETGETNLEIKSLLIEKIIKVME